MSDALRDPLADLWMDDFVEPPPSLVVAEARSAMRSRSSRPSLVITSPPNASRISASAGCPGSTTA
jgi:hypothetical protein